MQGGASAYLYERPEETRRSAHWIRSHQRADGSWATFHGGPGDLSTSVEAYVQVALRRPCQARPCAEVSLRFPDRARRGLSRFGWPATTSLTTLRPTNLGINATSTIARIDRRG